jgi:hypothetical protein
MWQWCGLSRAGVRVVRRRALLAFVAVALPSTASPDLELVFARRAGTSVAKRAELAVELLDTTVSFNGRDQRFGEDEVIRFVTSLACVDTYARVTDGVPRDLRRRFDEVAGWWEFNGKRQEIEDFSALTGCTVRFEWSPEREAHVRTLEVDESSVPRVAERIDGLVEDLDLRAFLTAGPIEPGARWRATGEPVMHALFGPLESGLVGIPAGVTAEALIRDVLLRPFRELGKERLQVECRLIGDTRQADDTEARIALRLVDRFELDVTNEVSECLRAWGGAASSIVVAGAAVAWRCDGKGELVWDTALQRFVSFDLKVRVDIDFRMDFPSASDSAVPRVHALQIRSECEATWSMVAEALPVADEHEQAPSVDARATPARAPHVRPELQSCPVVACEGRGPHDARSRHDPEHHPPPARLPRRSRPRRHP